MRNSALTLAAAVAVLTYAFSGVTLLLLVLPAVAFVAVMVWELAQELHVLKTSLSRDQWELEQRLAMLEERLKIIEAPEAATLVEPEPAVTEPEPASAPPEPLPEPPAPPLPVEQSEPTLPAISDEEEVAYIEPFPASPKTSETNFMWLIGKRVLEFFTEENAVVRVGLLLTFVGLALLYAYGLDRHWIGVEWNLILASLAGLAALVWGWRLREQRPSYSLLIQGGAVAVLYITIFAAAELYGFVPEFLAFALLVALVALATALALLQDSPSLAAAAAAGGYLVPLLLFGGSGGEPLPFFAYYMLLNAGVVVLALLRGWRGALMIGFAFTTSAGLGWGISEYHAGYFWCCELVLLLYFVMFSLAGALGSWRSRSDNVHPADLFLLFAVPAVSFAMQFFMVRQYAFGPALSALALAAYFVYLARWLWRHQDSTLSEVSLALSTGLLTLAIPLAVNTKIAILAWAVEGAVLVWLGLRQQREWLLVGGLALVGLVNLAFLREGFAILEGFERGGLQVWYSMMFLALVLWFVAWAIHTHSKGVEWLGWLRAAASLQALFWWLVAGILAIGEARLPLDGFFAALIWITASLGLALEIGQMLGWIELVKAFLALPLLLLPTAAATLFMWEHPTAAMENWLWLPTLAFWFYELIKTKEFSRRGRAIGLALGLWFLLALFGFEFVWWIKRVTPYYSVWPSVAFIWVLLLTLATLSSPSLLRRWPWLSGFSTLGLPGVALAVGAWVLFSALHCSGNSSPLPYLPLLNPLELTHLLAAGTLLQWWLRSYGRGALQGRRFYWAMGGGLFLWINTVFARSAHHLGRIPYDWETLINNQWFLAAISILWGASGLLLMVLGSRLRNRSLWQVGLGLYGLTVAKLFFVDLSGQETAARIVSFLGVGLLLVITGYFAPRPAADKEDS